MNINKRSEDHQSTTEKILDFIKYHGQARVEDLYHFLSISKVAIHKQLKKMLQKELIVRFGKPPIVFYKLAQKETKTEELNLSNISDKAADVIEKNFLSITPDGRILYGLRGFLYWVNVYQKNNSIETLLQKYLETWQMHRGLYTSHGWIDATVKLRVTFIQTPISHLLFQDVYSYPMFGRTKLAKLIMHAKQTGEKSLINDITDSARPLIKKIIDFYSIQAVGYIPPTIPRPVQFMQVLQSRLNLGLPRLGLTKVTPLDIPIPQKTLQTLSERSINARNSIFLTNTASQKLYDRVLLIDDVAGSGASFQETAKKLVHNNIGTESIIAFGFVGNIKGYDVIREI